MKRKKILSGVMAVTLLITSLGMYQGGKNKMASAATNKTAPQLLLQYDEPASDWESEALAIGNGNIGAMVFGGVASERLQINENSVWSGGPGASSKYDGGSNDYSNEVVHEALLNVRQRLQEMVSDFSQNNAAYINDKGSIVSSNYVDLLNNTIFSTNFNKLKGEKTNFGSYQTLGNIYIDDVNGSNHYENYLRTSDIGRAVQNITYTQDGVEYYREYFLNNPSNVLVAKYTASEDGMLNKTISITSEQTKKNIYVDLNEGTITMEGQPSDQSGDGLKFVKQVKIIPEGGTLTSSSNTSLTISGANSFVVIMSAGTNYKSDATTEYHYFEEENPIEKVEKWVEEATEKGYSKLYTEHVVDYRELFARCELNLGVTEVPNKMTDDLLKGYGTANNSAEDDLYLETLFFQFGRYLLIASSRENSKLPANLQGIWAQGLTPPWQSDYHTNINLQMNYWLAEQTSLTECHTAVIDYINDMVAKGSETAKKYYCTQEGDDVRGWVIHHENNIYGNTNPSYFDTAFYFPAAAAWMCQDIWEKYKFNDDKEFLAKYYDTMLQAALFWVDNLWTDERDGTLVANPSYSPEHGAYSIGCTADQAIIWELFEEVLQGADVLGKNNQSEVLEVKAAQEKLYMPSSSDLTLGGQYKEWKDETTLEITNADSHRHQNQLHVLHPGTYVVAGRSEEDDILMNAARITLEKRGDGGTGWSKAWKINMWARLRDGDRAKKLLGQQLTGSTLANLFDTHAPFQIDGNFGATSGVAEMLLQSQGDYIEPLAALPGEWEEGSYSGIKARGNFSVGVNWSDGMANKITVTSNSGNECSVRYNSLSECKVVDINTGKVITTKVIDQDTISFPTTKGSTYIIASMSTQINGSDEREILGAKMNNLYNASIKASLQMTSDNGAYITSIDNTSLAAKIGLQANDVIISCNDKLVTSTLAFETMLEQISVGTTIKVGFMRGGVVYQVSYKKSNDDNARYLPGKIQAETAEKLVGNVSVENCTDLSGSQVLQGNEEGAYARFMSVDFSAPITEVVVRAAAVANSRVTLRLDGMNGQVLARLNLVNTGDSQTYQDNRVDLSGMKDLSGIHDIYLVFDEAASINWIEFKASGTYSFPYLVSAVSLVPVTVNPTAVPPVVNISSPNVPTSPTTKISISKPKIKAIKSTKAKKMTITLKSKVKGANGYQIRYSQKKSMKSAKKATMKKSSILKKTIKGLKKGKKYYVQVRAYKTVGKKNYFSSWSTKKSITIKKK